MADAPDRLKQALADRYAIERELGAGGMATVYLAADLKHPRKVAIKVLRPELAAVVGAERFIQEIRVTATLQHPHILGLIDSGIVEEERGALPYYVMPYVDGESLRDKLKRETQLPIDEAVAITTAVASALDYAHRHGVIHRDIKPENILLHEGQALVTDFGIALALQSAGGTRLTETGLAVGTPQYMSPEQGMAEREIGPRSDVYALGCVVYEMLAGEPPFTGPTAQAIVAKAAHDTPRPLRLGRPSVPVQVESATAKALERLPADRFGSAGEFARALESWQVFNNGSKAVAPTPTARSPSGLAMVLVAALVIAVAAGVWGWRRSSAPFTGRGVVRFEIPFPSALPLWEDLRESRIALAPNGKTLVYLGVSDGIRRLFLRTLDNTTARPLAGTEGAAAPFYSPDSKWVGFVAGGQLKKVALAGGEPVSIAKTVGDFRGASWGDGGVIVFNVFVDSPSDRGLWQVPEGGGTPTMVIRQSSLGWLGFAGADFLPGGEKVLYGADSTINVVDLKTRRIDRIIGGRHPRYAGSDRMIFEGTNGLEAIRMNPRSLRVVGEPVALHIVPNVSDGGSRSEFAVSHEGTLIYVAEGSSKMTLALVDRRGTAILLAPEPARFTELSVSPNGGQVAVTRRDGDESDIWLYGVAKPTVSRLTFDHHADAPLWTPDGSSVSWRRSTYDTSAAFYLSRADHVGSPRRMRRMTSPSLYSTAWNVDGRSLFSYGGGPTHLWRMPIDSTVGPQRLTHTSAVEFDPVISPDGRWLAYTSNESGRWEVYVQDYPGMAGRSQVSLGGGLTPTWDRSGRALYYRSGNRLYSAAIGLGPAFSVTDRHLVFESPQLVAAARVSRTWDVTPDGRHFVMLQSDEQLERLVVVLNWAEELEVKP